MHWSVPASRWTPTTTLNRPADQLVTAGSNIVVHRVDYQDKVETQAIPYDTQYVYTSLYFRNTGRATTLQHGAEGQQTVTTRESAGWTVSWRTAWWWM